MCLHILEEKFEINILFNLDLERAVLICMPIELFLTSSITRWWNVFTLSSSKRMIQCAFVWHTSAFTRYSHIFLSNVLLPILRHTYVTRVNQCAPHLAFIYQSLVLLSIVHKISTANIANDFVAKYYKLSLGKQTTQVKSSKNLKIICECQKQNLHLWKDTFSISELSHQL